MDNQQPLSTSNSDLKIPPPNLPFKDTPVSRPAAERPSAEVVLPHPPPTVPKPIIPPPVLPVKPVPAQTPSPIIDNNPTLRSSIRTMESDIGSIKKNQPPTSVKVEGKIELTPKLPITQPPPKPISQSQVELGRMERSRNMASAPTVNIPPAKSSSSSSVLKWVLIGILVVLILGSLSWFLFFRQSDQVAIETPTPTPEITATPIPTPAIEGAFPTVISQVASPSASFTNFKTAAEQQLNVIGGTGLFKITDSKSNEYSFAKFAADNNIAVPADVSAILASSSVYGAFTRQADTTLSSGFIVTIHDEPTLETSLKNWEKTMPASFKTAFVLNPAKASTKLFLDNNYQTTDIRYQNFPDANLTIDYAIVLAPNLSKYLVFANSKAHMFSIIDRIKSIPPIQDGSNLIN